MSRLHGAHPCPGAGVRFGPLELNKWLRRRCSASSIVAALTSCTSLKSNTARISSTPDRRLVGMNALWPERDVARDEDKIADRRASARAVKSD